MEEPTEGHIPPHDGDLQTSQQNGSRSPQQYNSGTQIPQQYNSGARSPRQSYNPGSQSPRQQYNPGPQNGSRSPQQYNSGTQNPRQQNSPGPQSPRQQYNSGTQNTRQQYNPEPQSPRQQYNSGSQNPRQQNSPGPQSPRQQQHTPIQQQNAPPQQQNAPIQQQNVPIQQQNVPIQQQNVPIQQQLNVPEQHAPIQQNAPIQQHASIEQHQNGPRQQQQQQQQQQNPPRRQQQQQQQQNAPRQQQQQQNAPRQQQQQNAPRQQQQQNAPRQQYQKATNKHQNSNPPPKNSNKRDIENSKLLSYLLRHGGTKIGLPMSEDGWVNVYDLLEFIDVKKKNITLDDIFNIVKSNDKQRFSLEDDVHGYKIRANQGHSINVNVDMTPIKIMTDLPYGIAVHGTYFETWKLIQASGGLNRMGRQHIHFASELPENEKVLSGIRQNVEVLIYLDVEKCLEDQIPIFLSANNVILSPGIDGVIGIKYIKHVTDRNGNQINF